MRDGSLIRVPSEMIDTSNLIRVMCRDVECPDVIDIPVNLSRQEASSSLIIRDLLDADYIEEAVRLLKRVSVDGTPLLDREVNIIYNNPALLALAVYYSIISPSFDSPTDRLLVERLKYEYQWDHIPSTDLHILMLIAPDVPPPNEVGSRIIDLLVDEFPPEMFNNIVNHMMNIDDEFQSLELVKLGIRLDLINTIGTVEEAISTGNESDITWIVELVLNEYNNESAFLLYNIAFQYSVTFFIDRLPRYFSIDDNYHIKLSNSDRSEVTRQLVSHRVDPAYLVYLLTQSFDQGYVNLYQQLNELEADIVVNYRVEYDNSDIIEQLANMDRGSVRLYLNIYEANDEVLLQILDDRDMLQWILGNVDLANCVNIFDLLYVHQHPHWILIMEILPEYSPYLCYVLNSADHEDMGCDENKSVPGISLLEAIEQGDNEALEMNLSILQDGDVMVETSMRKIITNPVLQMIMSYRERGLVAEGLVIQLTDHDIEEFLNPPYLNTTIQVLTYLTIESINKLMKIKSTRRLIKSLYLVK